MEETDVSFDFLEGCEARPSIPGTEWVHKIWCHLQAVTDRIRVLLKALRCRSGKGEAPICAVLGASLAAAVETRNGELEDLAQTPQALKLLVQSLQEEVADLKKKNWELEEQVKTLQNEVGNEQENVRCLQEALVEKLLVCDCKGGRNRQQGTDAALSHGDCHKRNGLYPNGELEEARRPYDLPQGPLQPLRLLVKVEYAYEHSEDNNPRMVTKEVLCTATELAQLKKEYSRNPKDSETEYVWRVSLTGGDHIMLSEREAEGYWGPGVFLTTGDHGVPWSLTQRATYWAGGLNPSERGDPLALTGSVDRLVENVQKAACLQMMYDRELKFRQESPMMIPVDPERMTPLVRGLPDSLKPLGIQLQGTIRNTPQSAWVTAALTRAVTPDRYTLGQKVWTWGEVAQELINYGRKYGPVNTSSARWESKSLWSTEIKSPGSSTRLPPPRSPSRRNIPNRRNTLWSLGQQKGVPRDLMDGLPTDRLEELVSGWPKNLATKASYLANQSKQESNLGPDN
ncbi:uncharacterized protein [Nyctibius grandis]|uniref:uncharacterized protein n=1 Tax=Nyctibius grandis TaxID=48427 RepID=UPI0035BC1D3D